MHIPYEERGRKELGPEASKIAELVGHDGDNLGQVLKENPELVEGLSEYVVWRDKVNGDICEKQASPQTDHQIANLLRAKKEGA